MRWTVFGLVVDVVCESIGALLESLSVDFDATPKAIGSNW